MLPIDLENACGRAFSVHVPGSSEARLQLGAVCAAQREPCDTGFWQRCDDGWIVDSTSRGGWPVSRAVQDMFVLGVEHAPTKSDTAAPDGLTRIGLQDDIHRIGRCSQPVLE